ncbi:hypothetical protein [Chryseobacterium indologenes]|uniref:hypothetical protein n=1 Tax=Chryseobacterium indologenes TaxID=253 RepID=UPI0016233675|nr:hypothetical protein [Chryseobacterium indologenes]MBF6643917.1 hypothetical protein [Chryseobacterium indologenes]QQQ72355.1 hypothetical protein JHW31_06425 [Chryseobacterium indologenes]
MKKLFLIILLIVSNLATAQKTSKTIPLDSMIEIINGCMINANTQLSKRGFPLKKVEIKSAEISLTTSYDASGGGEFKLLVKAGKRWELEKTNTMKFVFEKIEKSEKSGQKSFPDLQNKIKFEKSLTNAIISAADQWQNSTQSITGLSKSEFSVEISFMVKETTSAGIEFEIWGIGVDSSADYENSAVHTIALTFK